MIISNAISEIYSTIYKDLVLMKRDVDVILKPLATQFDGFFISRIKGVESFAQKIEMGLTWNPDRIIDLYAATIVLPTFKEVDSIDKSLEDDFKIVKKFFNREKKPSDFIYDDKHVHLKYKHKVSPGKEYLYRRFELQIKTFLQHGWAKATHDILYKGDKIEWARFRMVSQIKAMLEQSDQILFNIDKIADFCEDNCFQEYKGQNALMEVMKKLWDGIQLPSNLRGTAQSAYDLLCISNQSVDEIVRIIKSGSHDDLIKSKSLTPHQVLLGIVIRVGAGKLYDGLKRNNRRVFISNELKDLLQGVPDNILGMSIKW